MEFYTDAQDAARFIVRHFAQEWAMITGAPVILIVVVGLCGFLIWLAMRSRFADKDSIIANRDSALANKDSVIEHLKERNSLKDDQLSILARRVGTNPKESPEEIVTAVTAKIDALDAKLTEMTLSARHVTSIQRRRLGEALPRILPELFRPPYQSSTGYGVRTDRRLKRRITPRN